MKTIVFYILLLFLVGCKSSEERSTGTLGLVDNSSILDMFGGDEAKAPERTENIEKEELPEIKQPDKIIKDANIRFEVDNYKTAKKEIDSLVIKWNAYIAKEDEQYTNYRIDNEIIIRVLNHNFENLLNAIGETSKKIDYKYVNSKDVTEEYIDIASRLKTKREVENRYYEILRKTTKIEDILKIEAEIGKIREEIEAKEGRLKYLDNRVSYSTITLEIYQKLDYKYHPQKGISFITRFYQALDKGWKGLISFIIALIYIWPIILIVTAGLIIYFRYKRKKETGGTEKNE